MVQRWGRRNSAHSHPLPLWGARTSGTRPYPTAGSHCTAHTTQRPTLGRRRRNRSCRTPPSRTARRGNRGCCRAGRRWEGGRRTRNGMRSSAENTQLAYHPNHTPTRPPLDKPTLLSMSICRTAQRKWRASPYRPTCTHKTNKSTVHPVSMCRMAQRKWRATPNRPTCIPHWYMRSHPRSRGTGQRKWGAPQSRPICTSQPNKQAFQHLSMCRTTQCKWDAPSNRPTCIPQPNKPTYHLLSMCRTAQHKWAPPIGPTCTPHRYTRHHESMCRTAHGIDWKDHPTCIPHLYTPLGIRMNYTEAHYMGGMPSLPKCTHQQCSPLACQSLRMVRRKSRCPSHTHYSRTQTE